jgi:hypothetical protein
VPTKNHGDMVSLVLLCRRAQHHLSNPDAEGVEGLTGPGARSIRAELPGDVVAAVGLPPGQKVAAQTLQLKTRLRLPL